MPEYIPYNPLGQNQIQAYIYINLLQKINDSIKKLFDT